MAGKNETSDKLLDEQIGFFLLRAREKASEIQPHNTLRV